MQYSRIAEKFTRKFIGFLFAGVLLYSVPGSAMDVTVAWSPSGGATGYKVYYQRYDSKEIEFVDVGNVTQHTFHKIENCGYTMAITAYNQYGESNYSETTYLPIQTIPDIKVNGSDGPIAVSTGVPLRATISLDPGEYAGQYADWWVVVKAPVGWFSYVLDTDEWESGMWLCDQKALFQLSSYNLTVPPLPAGIYQFYFAVDDNADGRIDSTWVDKVDVIIRR